VQQSNDAPHRTAGQIPGSYICHWRISGLAFLDWNVTKAYRASYQDVSHHFDDQELSRDSAPVTQSQIAQDGPKSASQDRSKMPANSQ
jgi:hypothetical protein